jgi:DNA-binding MarR family transcriptional regulator
MITMDRAGGPGGDLAAGDDLDDASRRVEEASLALVEMTLNAIVEEGDISVTQLRVLLAVDRYGPLNLSALAARLGTSISSAGRLVARLDTAGLLTRLISLHSRREITIEVAPLGRQTIQRLRATRRRHIASVLTRLPPGTRGTLARVLHEFAAATRHDEESTCVH